MGDAVCEGHGHSFMSVLTHPRGTWAFICVCANSPQGAHDGVEGHEDAALSYVITGPVGRVGWPTMDGCAWVECD